MSKAVRHLDHIVWPTRDLGALAETFRRLGFTVGSRNRHPWGTENHIVQFDGLFLELLGFAADYHPLPPDDPAAPFTAFCSDYLAGVSGGAAMLVLRSDDAAADAAGFRAQGLGAGRLLPFSRTARGPDGRDRTVAFTVAFAEVPGLPDIGTFACQHHRPENFWNPEAQRHANGAAGIAVVVISASRPAGARAALRSFVGQIEAAALPEQSSVTLANGRLEVVAAPPVSAGAPDGARIAALHVRTRDLDQLARALDLVGLPHSCETDHVHVAAATAGGTDLVFLPGVTA